ncbi:MAG: tetratricopeptide repeat protein [Spirochaetaceae bacterium]|jgi:Tfp pilus assembly protein PilF|nr:tetratricopeptide repeat protein [Spirochaetaceae bacterium]
MIGTRDSALPEEAPKIAEEAGTVQQQLTDLSAVAQESLREGKLKEAVDAFTALLTLEPQYVPAYNGLGLVYTVLRKYTQGGMLFRRGLALEPDNAVLHYNYGQLLAAQGRLERARLEYQEALRCRPEWYKPANKLGMILGKQGRYANALEILSANLKFNPRNPEIRETIKQVLAEQEAARQSLKKQEEKIDLPTLETLWGLAVSLMDMVDLLKYLARLAEYLPTSEREHFMKSETPGIIYNVMGLVAKAAKH